MLIYRDRVYRHYILTLQCLRLLNSILTIRITLGIIRSGDHFPHSLSLKEIGERSRLERGPPSEKNISGTAMSMNWKRSALIIPGFCTLHLDGGEPFGPPMSVTRDFTPPTSAKSALIYWKHYPTRGNATGVPETGWDNYRPHTPGRCVTILQWRNHTQASKQRVWLWRWSVQFLCVEHECPLGPAGGMLLE